MFPHSGDDVTMHRSLMFPKGLLFPVVQSSFRLQFDTYDDVV